MASCLSQWVLRGRACRHRLASIPRRTYSSNRIPSSTRLTYVLPQNSKIRHEELFEKLQDHDVLANSEEHDAALMLVTPDLVKHLDDEKLMGRVAQLLSGHVQTPKFHLLTAVVDHIAPQLGSYKPLAGISILRGHLGEILPGLWHETPPRTKEDADSVAALTFQLGRPTVTLPLTRTIFLNNRPSTLMASLFDFSGPEPRLVRRFEKHSQDVKVPSLQSAQSIGDLGLYAPLAPVTRPRIVAGSFGNIVKAVEVNGEVVPASTELEDAVNAAYQRNTSTTPKAVGIWAMVAPASFSQLKKDALSQGSTVSGLALDENADPRELAHSTAHELKDLYAQGGRIYKILSGGGGWGAKKGLLSLDPQQTHFSLSEEEEMERFMRTMENESGFAPPGSIIQFLTSIEAPSGEEGEAAPAVVFGVPGDIYNSKASAGSDSGYFIEEHFGALSNHGIYISGPESTQGSAKAGLAETKLTVPHSRIYITDQDSDSSSPPWYFWSLADADAIALAGEDAIASALGETL